MCVIVCAFNLRGDKDLIRSNVLEMAQKVRHRGPDWSGIYSSDNAILAHERLAIVDPTSGKQPIISEDGLNKNQANARGKKGKEAAIAIKSVLSQKK